MRRLPALLVTAAAAGLALGVIIPGLVFAEGNGVWVKLLFTPQAGVNSACLSCGWHSGACGSTRGPALDFPANCSDGGQQVYFRTFAFLPPGSAARHVGSAAYYMPTPWQCKEVQAKIWDTEGNLLGRIRYVHAEPLYLGTIQLLASADGLKNELAFAEMANPDKQECIDEGWWQWDGVHVHESHLDDTNTFFLRNDRKCGPNCQEGEPWQRYPCGSQPSYCYPNPQDWWNEWVRGFCIHDTDCDGWTDDQETFMGTDPEDECADTSDLLDERGPAYGEPLPPWPPDFNDNGTLDIGDLILLRTWWFGTYSPRYDLNARDGKDVGDLIAMRNKWFADNSCTVG